MTSARVKPFLMQFATPMRSPQPRPSRYDPRRGVVEVLLDGSWVPHARVPLAGPTRVTDVEMETTDDD